MTPVNGCRFGDRCSLDTFESALVCLSEHSEMTRVEIVNAVARLHPGKSETYLRACLSQYDQSHNLQLQVAPFFTTVSGNPALLAWHARSCGYGIHRMPSASHSRDELYASFVDVSTAHGDLARALRSASADRRLTGAERVDITLRAQREIQELVELIAAVNLEAEPSEARLR